MINYDNGDEIFIGRDWGQTRNYSEGVAKHIDDEVKNIIDECYNKAKEIINDNIDILHESAELLIKKEKINRDEFEVLFGEKIDVNEAVKEKDLSLNDDLEDSSSDI